MWLVLQAKVMQHPVGGKVSLGLGMPLTQISTSWCVRTYLADVKVQQVLHRHILTMASRTDFGFLLSQFETWCVRKLLLLTRSE
jgi:hypothetical protein